MHEVLEACEGESYDCRENDQTDNNVVIQRAIQVGAKKRNVMVIERVSPKGFDSCLVPRVKDIALELERHGMGGENKYIFVAHMGSNNIEMI